MTLLENVRLPLEELHGLDNDAIDLIGRMKLELVGLEQFTGHLRGNFRRHAKARGDRPRDGARPDDPLSRRALGGTRSDHVGVARRADRRLAENLDVTFVIVTHELASIFAVADRVIMLDKRKKGIIAEGDPRVLRDTSENPWVRQFFHREPDHAVA